MPTFEQIYQRLIFLQQRNIPVHVVSTNNTTYSIEARLLNAGPNVGNRVIVCTIEITEQGNITNNPKPRIYIHEDCWANETTCGGTFAGGIYNGKPSIYDWFQ